MNAHVADVGGEAALLGQEVHEGLGQGQRDAVDLIAAAADQMDVNLVLDGVVRGRSMTEVGMGDESDLFENLERPVDSGEIDPRGPSLHFGQYFFGGPVP